MEEKLTKTLSIAEVKDAPEAPLIEPNSKNDRFEAVKTAVLPGTHGEWTEERLIQFADFIVSCGDMSYANISRGLDREERYVSNVLYTYPKLKELVRERRQAWFDEQMSLAQKVYLNALIDPEVPWTNKLATAKDIMSKAGYDATRKVENTNREVVVEIDLDED